MIYQFQKNINKIQIIGTGHYVPEKRLSNNELSKLLGVTPEWIKKRTGIEERRIASAKETTSDLALKSAKRAISSAGIKAKEIDLILVATSSPDTLIPSTACKLQSKLKIKSVPAFDLQASCSGFLYALATASAFIQANFSKTVLIVGAEIRSRFIDYKDPKLLAKYITYYRSIQSRFHTGVCLRMQKRLAKAIKRARIMGLLPTVRYEKD